MSARQTFKFGDKVQARRNFSGAAGMYEVFAGTVGVVAQVTPSKVRVVFDTGVTGLFNPWYNDYFIEPHRYTPYVGDIVRSRSCETAGYTIQAVELNGSDLKSVTLSRTQYAPTQFWFHFMTDVGAYYPPSECYLTHIRDLVGLKLAAPVQPEAPPAVGPFAVFGKNMWELKGQLAQLFGKEAVKAVTFLDAHRTYRVDLGKLADDWAVKLLKALVKTYAMEWVELPPTPGTNGEEKKS